MTRKYKIVTIALVSIITLVTSANILLGESDIISKVAASPSVNLGLVAHYTFDEGSGITVADSSGNGNTGTFSGSPTWTGGKIGSGALEFHGSDYITFKNSNSLILNSRSYSFWAKPSVLSGIQGITRDSSAAWGILFSNANLQVYWYDGSNAPLYKSVSIGSAALWKHIVVTENVTDSNFELAIYLDGSQIVSFSNSAGFTNRGFISQIGTNGGYGLKGVLDDVRIYDRALSIAEVSELYLLGSKTQDSTPSTPTNISSTPSSSTTPSTSPVSSNPSVQPTVQIPPEPVPHLTSPRIYYVDYVAGNNANDGLSKNTAWKHTPGDTEANGKPASVVLKAGDRVKFKGGTIYMGGFTVSTSGAADAPIIYDGNINNDWGSGRAVLDRNFLLNSSLIKLSRGVSNVHVLGFELRNAGGYSDNDPVVINAKNGIYGNSTNAISTPRPGTGVDMSSGGNHNILLDSLYIHHIGIWHSTLGWNGRSISGNGIWANSPSSLTIRNCELTKIGSVGIALYAPLTDIKDVLITDCYLHNDIPQWGIDIAPQRVWADIENVTITNSRFENLWSNWSGTNDDPLNGTTAPHQNYIFFRQAGSPSNWKNINITNNWFGETDIITGLGGTGAIFLSQGPSVNIYNNVFARSWSYTGTIPIGYPVMDGMKQVVRIYNNTFHRGTGSIITLAQKNIPGVKEIYIENNLFVNPSGKQANNVMIASDQRESVKALDYNMYWSPDWTAEQMYVIIDEGGKKLSELQKVGLEVHGYYNDPLFIDSTNPNWALRDYRLKPNSPAIGKGKNLSEYFTIDAAGNQRPSTGPWTIGAYEYSSNQSMNPVHQPVQITTQSSTPPQTLPNELPRPQNPTPAQLQDTRPDMPGGGGGNSNTSPQPNQVVNSMPSMKYSFVRTLTVGSTGNDVKVLQQTLNSLGYTVSVNGAGSKSNETTYFGPATTQALKRYQCTSLKICTGPEYGILGTSTRNALNTRIASTTSFTSLPANVATTSVTTTFYRNLSPNMTGEDVRNLQKLLNSKGYTVSTQGSGSPNLETVFYGPATTKAVQRFQCATMNICSGSPYTNGYGNFGPKTRTVIKKIIEI